MIGVIPAGGRATRFMGIYKDMLPIGNETFLISEAMARARTMGADRCVIVSSSEKAALHERFLKQGDSLLISTDHGLWEAISATFFFQEDSLLVLADTVFTPIVTIPAYPLTFGVFTTEEPWRFSVMDRGTILTKPAIEGVARAWGCVAWSKEVVAFWQGKVYDHYDDAFRDAMASFDYAEFPIRDYYDLGTWEAYRQFILEH